jgi:hypothetical protein
MNMYIILYHQTERKKNSIIAHNMVRTNALVRISKINTIIDYVKEHSHENNPEISKFK